MAKRHCKAARAASETTPIRSSQKKTTSLLANSLEVVDFASRAVPCKQTLEKIRASEFKKEAECVEQQPYRNAGIRYKKEVESVEHT